MLGTSRRALRRAGRCLSAAAIAAALNALPALASVSSEGAQSGQPPSIAQAWQASADANYWPTRGWRESTPEAQGLDSRTLAIALDTIHARRLPVANLLIERHGAIVLDADFYPYADGRPRNVFSVTKSVTASLVGIALAEGKLASLAESLGALMPEAIQSAEAQDKAGITLADLLSMTSGLDCGNPGFLQQMERSRHWVSFALARPEAAAPGQRFEYCAGNMHLVSAVLTRVTGESAADFARSRLFEPLGISDIAWPKDADGISHGFADIRMSPRDMAKLGYLWLHHGEWDGRQIIPAAYLDEALTPHANVEPGVEYGYGMWIYRGHGHAGGPPDFEANGAGGQRIAVIPSQDMVVVITGQGLDANDVASLICDVVKSDTALPDDMEARTDLETRIAEARVGHSVDRSFVLAQIEKHAQPSAPAVAAPEPGAILVAAVTPRPRPEAGFVAAPEQPAAIMVAAVAPRPRPRPSVVAPAAAPAAIAAVTPRPRPEIAAPVSAMLVAAVTPRARPHVTAPPKNVLVAAVVPKPRPNIEALSLLRVAAYVLAPHRRPNPDVPGRQIVADIDVTPRLRLEL